MNVGQQEKKDTVLIETAGDNVYYNVTFVNNNANGNFLPVKMQFRESRTTSLLPGNTIDYKMSVVRFEVPTDLIPIQFFPTQADEEKKSEYSVTITYDNLIFQEFLQWNTEDDTAPVPRAPYAVPSKPFYHDYYAVYSVEHLVRLINRALLAAHNLAFNASVPGILEDYPPFLNYNSATGLISLYAPTAYNSEESVPINIYFNAWLISNFGSSFPSVIHDHHSLTGQDTQLLVTDNILNRHSIIYPEPPGPDRTVNYFIMVQEFNALSLMLDFSSIVMTSGTLPMRNEWVNIQGNNDNNYQAIVSDFLVPQITGNEIRNKVIYYPTAQYRYSTLINNLPINVIDLQFYWKSKRGLLVPIFISPFREGSVKILFEKK